MPRPRRALPVFLLLLAAALALGSWLYVPEPGEEAPHVVVSVDRSLWNRLGLNQFTYVRALRRAGARVRLVEFPSAEPASGAADLLRGASGLVLTGGGDVAAHRYGGDPSVTIDVKPDRDSFELALLEAAGRQGLPVLGLCRGAQLINVFLGGTLGDHRDDADRYGRHQRILPGHGIRLAPDSRLAGIYGTTTLESVVTWHGQFVDKPGRGVRVVGRAPDGTPEAIEVASDKAFGMLGVQWHAEMPPGNSDQAPLFEAFAAAAGKRARSTSPGAAVPAVP